MFTSWVPRVPRQGVGSLQLQPRGGPRLHIPDTPPRPLGQSGGAGTSTPSSSPRPSSPEKGATGGKSGRGECVRRGPPTPRATESVPVAHAACTPTAVTPLQTSSATQVEQAAGRGDEDEVRDCRFGNNRARAGDPDIIVPSAPSPSGLPALLFTLRICIFQSY